MHERLLTGILVQYKCASCGEKFFVRSTKAYHDGQAMSLIADIRDGRSELFPVKILHECHAVGMPKVQILDTKGNANDREVLCPRDLIPHGFAGIAEIVGICTEEREVME